MSSPDDASAPTAPRERALRARRAIGAGLLAGSAGLFSWGLWPDAAPPARAAGPPPEGEQSAAAALVTAEGREAPSGMSREEAARRAAELSRRFLDGEITVRAGELERVLTRADLGARVDEGRLAALLRATSQPGSPLAGAVGTEALPLPVRLEPETALSLLVELKGALDQPARDARIDLATGAVHPEQEGLALDAWDSLDRFLAGLRTGRDVLEAAVEHTPAHRTAAQLEGASVATVLGTFSTPYNGTEEARDRTHNLRVGAEKIHGMVLLPGEVFDFNAVVGERSQANGFRPAPVIAGGELVDGVGGGACQLAGTLHAAVFFAGLEVVERNPHSRPSSYIKLGLDAAVSYPNLNFRFRNSTDAPVVVELTVTGGQVTANLRGARQDDQVTFVRRIDAFAAFPERTVEDPALPAGVRVLTQRGVPGFTVSRWRIRRDPEANQAIREVFPQDSYPPTVQIWRVGSGGPAPAGFVPPAGDTHLEYRADEYTTITQGPGIDGQETTRRAGRTGAPGWTEREGMPPAR